MSCIDCPQLVVKATDSPTYMAEDVAARIVKVMKNNNPDFVYHSVEGGHHVHMDKADEVAAVVAEFINRPFDNSGTEEKENMKFSM